MNVRVNLLSQKLPLSELVLQDGATCWAVQQCHLDKRQATQRAVVSHEM